MKANHDMQFKKFLDILEQLHISTPLFEALEEIPNYMKFFKAILSKKRKLPKFKIVALIGCRNALVSSKIQPKLNDLRSFTISCSIEGQSLGRALYDLGANISSMHCLVFAQLGIGEMKAYYCDITISRQFNHQTNNKKK